MLNFAKQLGSGAVFVVFNKYNRIWGGNWYITRKTEFMSTVGLQGSRTASDCMVADTVADSAPLLLMQLVTPIRD